MSKPFLRNLQIGFGFSLVLLLASSTASYISIKEQINNRTKVDHSRRVIASANKILNDLQNAETGQRGFHLTGKETFLEPYINSQKSLPQALILTRELVTDNPKQSQVADSLSSLVNSRLGILANLITIKRQGGDVSLAQLEEGDRKSVV